MEPEQPAGPPPGWAKDRVYDAPEIRPSTYTVPLYRRSPLERAKRAQQEIYAHQVAIVMFAQTRKEAIREMTATMTYREIGAALGISHVRVSEILREKEPKESA